MALRVSFVGTVVVKGSVKTGVGLPVKKSGRGLAFLRARRRRTPGPERSGGTGGRLRWRERFYYTGRACEAVKRAWQALLMPSCGHAAPSDKTTGHQHQKRFKPGYPGHMIHT